jgi:hypothetical protein
MNLATIQSLVTRNLGGRTDIASYSLQWINSTYMDLITKGKFPELNHFQPIPVPQLDADHSITTSLGDYDHPVPADFLFPISCRNVTSNHGMRLKDIRWYDRKRSVTNGDPWYYIPYKTLIYFSPTPNGVYSINMRYRKKLILPTLVDPTDVPVIGEEWHLGLVLGATYMGARSLNFPEADKWKTDLKEFVLGHSEQTTEEEEDYEGGFNFQF